MRLGTTAWLALAVLLALAGAVAAARSGSVYVVANLAVEAKAKDAVRAKKKAFAEAQQRAMAILLRRIVPFGAYDRLPVPKLSVVEEMIDDLSVRRESNSATRYLATLDFTFQGEAVRQYLAGYGLPYVETRAPLTTVLPILVEDGKIARSTINPWRKAWLGLDLVNTITPVRLANVGGAVTADVVEGLLVNDDSAYEQLNTAYKNRRLVVVLAAYNAAEAKLSTRFYGVDAAGAIGLAREDRVWAGDLTRSLDHAALVALGILEGRWKAANAPAAAAGVEGPQAAFGVTVEFAGMQQWQKMRARLTRVPGVQALKVTSLSARSADVTMQFPGGAESLARQLGSYNLYLENAAGRWILRGN